LTTDPVICGIARGDADEHFVRRNPKECEVRWREEMKGPRRECG
jgi:hypothetical protein